MSKIWSLLIFVLHVLSAQYGFSAQPSCIDIFLESKFPLIALAPRYRGEDKGEYLDPILKKPWNVVYFSAEERLKYQLFVQNGRFIDKNGNLINTKFDDENFFLDSGLFVIDRDYRMYLLPFNEIGKYHHSSLSAGGPVRFAGTIAVMNGVLRELSNQSGHYRPNGPQTLRAMRWLQESGINFNQAYITGDAAFYFSKTYSMKSDDFLPLLQSLTP
jgi:hypothetical protein